MKKKYFLSAILFIAAWNGFAQPEVTIEWAVSCGSGNIDANSPALSVSGDTVYFVNDTDGKLHAFNASDGTKVWDFPLNVASSNPARTSASVGSDGTIYVPAGSNSSNPAYLYAVNPNGTEKWKYEIGSGANITYISPAITKDGDILVGNNGTNGALHLVDGLTGARKAYVKPSGGVLGAITVSQDNVAYSQAGNNGFNAYDLNSIDEGTLAPAHLGSYKPVSGNFYSVGSPAIDGNGNFLAAGGSGGIVSLHINTTLSANWVYPAGTNLSKIEQSGVAVGAGGTLYVAGSENKKIFALNPDGTLKWEFDTNANANSTPAVDNLGYIHFGDDSGNYYILEDKGTKAEDIHTAILTTGSVIANRIWSSPAIANDGSVYITAKTSGDIYLFKINVEGVTAPANSYWPMKGGNAQRSGLQRDRLWSEDASLKQLEVFPGTLDPAFDAATFSYTVNVAGDVEAIDVTGIATDANAVVSGNVTGKSLAPGDNIVTITVTAADKTHTDDYVVTVKLASPTTVSGLQKAAPFEILSKNGTLEIKAYELGELSVYGITGESIFSQAAEPGSSSVVPVYSGGVYLVKFNNEVDKIIIR